MASDLFIVGALAATTGVPAICGYLKWRAWMKLNRYVFDKTGDPDVFAKTASIAKALDRQALTDRMGTLVPLRLRPDRQAEETGQPPNAA